jgi:hypothetical protein
MVVLCCAECHGILLSEVMPSVILFSVVMLNAMATNVLLAAYYSVE